VPAAAHVAVACASRSYATRSGVQKESPASILSARGLRLSDRPCAANKIFSSLAGALGAPDADGLDDIAAWDAAAFLAAATLSAASLADAAFALGCLARLRGLAIF
jgi:hypothetical protein